MSSGFETSLFQRVRVSSVTLWSPAKKRFTTNHYRTGKGIWTRKYRCHNTPKCSCGQVRAKF